ncbi:MAG: hypothetical protein EA351_00250 [Gemmatimonadales bacterium]|nr:MAG: hypothetical protein EA351_00250 [Gemmatimonadales bacterium]
MALVATVLILMLPVSAAGQDDPLSGVVWTAAALEQLLSERDYPAILALALVNRSADAPDQATWAATAGSLLSVLGGPASAGDLARVDRCRGLDDPVEGTLCSLEAMAPLLPSGLGRELTDEGARLISLYLRPGEPIPAGIAGIPVDAPFGGESRRFSPLQAFAEQAIEGTLRLQGWNLPGEETANGELSALVAGLMGFTPDDAVSDILAQAPRLEALVRAHPAVASLQSSQATIREYRSFLTSVTDSDAAFDWATQRSFVYLASRTASLAGIETGVTDRIRALGNAATDLRQEGYAFRANLGELGQQVALAALSGNVFTLASGVASFFQLTPGAMGPSATVEIRALRDMVDSLRDEMAEGFEGIDLRFDEVMAELDQGFGRMEVLVARNHQEVVGELTSLGNRMDQLSGQIDRLDQNLVTYMQAGFDREFSRTLIRCLEHRERHLPPFDRLEFGPFSECLTDFRARGARDARDALLTDRTTPVDDRSLMQALADTSQTNLAFRLPLLARAAEQRLGYAGMAGGRGGANPVEWTVATQAYLAMLTEWPENAAGVSPGDLEALLATGTEIQRTLNAITVDPSGTPGGVLQRVLDEYQAGAAALSDEAETLAQRYQQEQLRRVDPQTLMNRMVPEAPGRPTLAAPTLVSGSIPQELRTAAVLALEEPTLVYRTVATDSITRENVRRRWILFGKRHDRVTHTRVHIQAELRITGDEVVARYRAQGPMVLRRFEEMAGDVDSDRVRSVDERVPDPEAHFLEHSYPAMVNSVVAWQITPAPASLRSRLEGRIEEELRRYESASLNRVFSSVCQDAAELTDADRASALRMRYALERMTTARTLLGAYARLAQIPIDPEMDVLLYGDDGLLDRPALCRVVAAGESPLRVVWLEREPMERALALSALLDETLEEIPTTMVDETVQQLRAAIRLQRVRGQLAN